MNKTYIIGEIGVNANGDIKIAKRLIDVAVACGCDAVKFQKRNPDLAVPEAQKNIMRDTPWGKMTYLDYKKRIEFDAKQYDELSQYCAGRIDWSVSVWDLDSLEFIKNFKVPFIKVPSAKMGDEALLQATAEYCSEQGIKLIVSTGMMEFEEIENSVYCIHEGIKNPQNGFEFVIMYCKSSYPAPVEDLNLSCISTLREQFEGTSYPDMGSSFQTKIGYSGHEFKLITTCAAVYLGAQYIERHITLDRSMWGTDQLASVEPDGLHQLVTGIRSLETAIGDGKITITELEKPIRAKLRGN